MKSSDGALSGRLLGGSAIVAGLTLQLAPPALAQDTAGAAAAPGATSVTELVVTGSRIPRIGVTSPSPVAVLTNQEAKLQGVTHIEDLVNSLPQVNAGLNESQIGILGIATVDLRGIGAFRTLVLMDGRRLNPSDPIDPVPDLNAIPQEIVKRVEVLTGGASSIYGSDAIAGVVNFITDRDFNGLRMDAEYSFFQDDNNYTNLQELARSSGIAPPTGSVADGGVVNISVVAGKDFDGGRGHVTAYAGYRHNDAITAASRDYSICNLTETATFFSCVKDFTTSPAFFQDAAGDSLTLDPATGNTFRPFDVNRDGYNTAPYQYLARPDERFDAGFFANWRFSSAVQLYAEGQFAYDYTEGQFAPSGTLLNTFGVNCDNPLLSANEAATLCAGLGPTDIAQVTIGKRNVEGLPVTDGFEHSSYRFVVGLKGDLNDRWSYDVYGQYGVTHSTYTTRNDVSLAKLGRALDVVSVGGVPTCASVVDQSDPSCVPYDIFNIGAVTPAAESYISEGGAQHGYADQIVVSGDVVGKLGAYGIKSPWADEGVGIVGGAEFRQEGIGNTPDPVFVTGDLAFTSPSKPFDGTYRVYEIFGETHIPIAQDRPLLHSLSLDLADRYARYSLQGSVNSYKIGGDWAPVSDFRVRATYSKAIRAPNGHELFQADTIQQFPISDPCSGPTPAATLAQCENSGVTPAEYGRLPDTHSFNYVVGGNIHVRPETAKTLTVGGVFTPRFASGFWASVDYWDIKVDGYIGQFAPNASLSNCLTTGNPIFCDLIVRDASGSISLGQGLNAGHVIATQINTGSFQERGIDIEANYALPLGAVGAPDRGELAFHFVGSVALDSAIALNPSEGVFDCTGLFGPTCTGEGPNSPVPTWRHQLRLTWSKPGFPEVSLNWRHVAHLHSELGSIYPHLQSMAYPVDIKIPAYDYFDLAMNMDLLKRYNLRAGISNIFDRRPPVIGANANPQVTPGNMAAQIYDIFGRYIYVGVTAKF
ncbi:MAG TPA: TonB-dependent receptor [Caulobacteraceae bacterium]|nr:TonB-dependent receptor [Caulobacteraceae bacterium]